MFCAGCAGRGAVYLKPANSTQTRGASWTTRCPHRAATWAWEGHRGKPQRREDSALQGRTFRSTSWYFTDFLVIFFKGSNVFILYYGGSGAPLSLGEKNTQSFPVSLGFLTRVGETQVQDKAEVSFALSSPVPRALVSPGGSQAEAGKWSEEMMLLG